MRENPKIGTIVESRILKPGFIGYVIGYRPLSVYLKFYKSQNISLLKTWCSKFRLPPDDLCGDLCCVMNKKEQVLAFPLIDLKEVSQ